MKIRYEAENFYTDILFSIQDIQKKLREHGLSGIQMSIYDASDSITECALFEYPDRGIAPIHRMLYTGETQISYRAEAVPVAQKTV